MRAIYLMLVLFLLAVTIAAQSAAVSSSDAPKIEVVQKEWYMEVNNPAFDKSPFAPIEDIQQANQTRRTVQRQNAIRARRGLPPLRTPNPVPQSEPENGRAPNVYTYKAKIRNTGEKEIQTLVWDYVFFEPGTQREVGRVQFVNKVKIPPGKTKSLSISTLDAPSATINVKDTGKKLRDQYTDQIVIQSIEYADGTVWDAPVESPK